jgi:hypothetical protein
MRTLGESTALPPVTVACGCGHRFASRARHQMPVHCPGCGRSVRVKRPPGPAIQAPGDRRAAGHLTPGPSPPGPAVVAIAADDDDGDDGETYIYDERGQLVRAEWTDDGRLVPATAAADHAAELEMRGYIVSLASPAGACPIVNTTGVNPGLCGGAARSDFGPYRICERHHRALTTPLSQRPRIAG